MAQNKRKDTSSHATGSNLTTVAPASKMPRKNSTVQSGNTHANKGKGRSNRVPKAPQELVGMPFAGQCCYSYNKAGCSKGTRDPEVSALGGPLPRPAENGTVDLEGFGIKSPGLIVELFALEAYLTAEFRSAGANTVAFGCGRKLVKSSAAVFQAELDSAAG
eukprot:1390450-Amphidinium_carterae.1